MSEEYTDYNFKAEVVKMETTCSSETTVTIYKTMQRQMPEESSLQQFLTQREHRPAKAVEQWTQPNEH
jgi:hypothetical protein